MLVQAEIIPVITGQAFHGRTMVEDGYAKNHVIVCCFVGVCVFGRTAQSEILGADTCLCSLFGLEESDMVTMLVIRLPTSEL